MLDKQNIQLLFDKALNKKADPKTLQAGEMVTLENVKFNEINAYLKRDGYLGLTPNILGGGSISKGVAFGTLGNTLTMLDGTNLFAFSEADQLWVESGTKATLGVSLAPVTANIPLLHTTLNLTSAYHSSGLMLCCWTDVNGVVNYIVYDTIANVPVTSVVNTSVGPGGNGTMIAKMLSNNKFVILWHEVISTNSVIGWIFVDVSTPSSFTSGMTTAGHRTGNQFPISAFVNTTNIFVLIDDGIFKFDLAMSLQASNTSFAATFLVYTTLTFDPSTNHLWGTFQDANVDLLAVFICDLNLNTILSYTTVTGTTYTDSVTGAVNISDVLYYFTGGGGGTVAHSGSIDNTGTLIEENTLIQTNLNGYPILVSEVFLTPNNIPSAMFGWTSTLQATYFVMNSKQYSGFKYGTVQSRILSGLAGPSFNSSLFAVNQVSPGVFKIAVLEQINPQSTNGVITSSLALNILTLDYTEKPQSVDIANNIHYNGGLVSLFDSTNTVEQGFNLYPEYINLGVGARSFAPVTIGGALTPGTYQYKAIYEWVDVQGNIQRSATSPAFQVVIPPSISFVGAAGSGQTVLSPNTSSDFVFSALLPIGSNVNSTLFPLPDSRIISWNGNTAFNVNQTAGATASAIVTGTVAQSFAVSSVDISLNALRLTATPTKYVELIATGANTFLCYDIRGLATGQSIDAQSDTTTHGFPAFTTITVTPNGDGSGTITTSSNYTGTLSVFIASITRPSGNFLFTDILYIGQTVTSTNASPGSKIVSFAGGIVLDLPVINTTPTVAYITGTYAVVVSVPTLPFTDKIQTGQNVMVNLYRTEANGNIYRKVASVSNDITNYYVSLIDNVSDLVLEGNQQLYTTGGVLDNFPGPASISMTTYKNRVLLVPSENPLTWWFSKQVVQGAPVEFSNLLTQTVDSRGGFLTAIGAMDDKIILFKKRNIFYVVGNGPSSNGLNNDFSYPQLITTDKGCTNPYSIVTIPLGLMFQTDNGIYLLTRGLELVYAGAAVSSYMQGANITGASLVPNTTEVRFTLDSGIALMYDYFVNKWSVHTNINAIGALIYKDLFHYLQSSGVVERNNIGVYTDDGTPISRKLVTGWISLANYQGLQRVYELLIGGEWKSPHTMNIQIAYDFETSPSQTVTPIVSNSLITPFQYRVFFTKQKCQSMQLTLSDADTTPYGAAADLSGFAIRAGVKKGLNKMPAAQSFG